MSHSKLTRRNFLKNSAAAAAGIAAGMGPRLARAQTGSPNAKLKVAAIGCGGMGFGDTMNMRNEHVVALCDVDARSSERAFYEFPKAKKYKDFREMLEKEDLDAVTISTPDHTHAVAAMAAMSLGIHVYVQKPLTHTVAEARMLRDAARKYGVKTQMGNQGHCSDGTRTMCEMIGNGDIGEIREVHFWMASEIWTGLMGRPKERPSIPKELDWDLWLSAAPTRPYHPAYLPGNWRNWFDFGGGTIGDMGCHICDTANWALRLHETGPSSVESLLVEGMSEETFPRSERIRWEFPARGDLPPVTAYWHDGLEDGKPLNITPIEGLPEASRIVESLGVRDSGFTLFVGDKGAATITGFGANPRLFPDERMADYKFPDKTIPRVPEMNPVQDWIDSIKNDSTPSSNFEVSGPLTEWVNLANVSLRHEGKLEWDNANLKVTNNTKANYDVTREYREGWNPAQFA